MSRNCAQDDTEKKITSADETVDVSNLGCKIMHSYNNLVLVTITADSVVRIPTRFAELSRELTMMMQMYVMDSSKRKIFEFEDKCILELPGDDVPLDSWEFIGEVVRSSAFPMKLIRRHALDDMLYIFHKYNIKLSAVVKDLNSFTSEFVSAIVGLCEFPRMQVEENNPMYWGFLHNSYWNAIIQIGNPARIFKSITKHSPRMASILLSELYSMVPKRGISAVKNDETLHVPTFSLEKARLRQVDEEDW